METDSTLTDCESEEDIYTPAKKKGRAKKEWQPKHVLRAPRLTHYSTATLYEEILNGKVDLEPEYQRDVVWNDTKQSSLIDSIIGNFFIPPIIFAFSQTEDGEERRVCIDGKQRLTSIQRFMDGQIPLKDSRTNMKLWYKLAPGNEKGRLLPPQYRKQFDLKQISCVEYTDITEDSEREIFQRVQLGIALTPAERMQAIAGPWPKFVRRVLTSLEEYRISDALGWARTRGRDFLAIACIIHIMDKSSRNYPGVSALEKWLGRVGPPQKSFEKRVMNAFRIFRYMVLKKPFSDVFKKPTHVAPIEFILIAVLIDAHCKDHTLTQLAEAIRLMRKDVRSKHDDIRSNSKVAKTMFSFIYDDWPGDLKRVPGEKLALEAANDNDLEKPFETGKRKRADDAEPYSDSSEDDRPLKSKAKAASKAKSAASSVKEPSKTNVPSPSAPASKLTPKPETKDNIKMEDKSSSQLSAQTSRLAGIRAAKERLGMLPKPQAPAPPPSSSARSTPVQQAPTPSAGTSVRDQAASIMNSSQLMMPPNMWPNQQFHRPFTPIPHFNPPPNMPIPGQGQVMPPPSAASPVGNGTGAYRSGPPTPTSQGPNVWPPPNDSNHTAPPNQRGSSTPTLSGLPGSTPEFKGPRQPPTGSSPGMAGREWVPGPNDRSRDREVLGQHSGSINGCERDRNYSSGSWTHKNGQR